ncbi:unnamed protein product [Staurois parvus]|uniref:Uncharacterized protein n=1 Tax=Staurois parvus TaxID=386267 RepID=A0ABN9FC49_9NEOB|nr:unnamed protein product [Staurois parvus]
MCSLPPRLCSINRWIGDSKQRGGSDKTGSKFLFIQCRELPLRFYSEYTKNTVTARGGLTTHGAPGQ